MEPEASAAGGRRARGEQREAWLGTPPLGMSDRVLSRLPEFRAALRGLLTVARGPARGVPCGRVRRPLVALHAGCAHTAAGGDHDSGMPLRVTAESAVLPCQVAKPRLIALQRICLGFGTQAAYNVCLGSLPCAGAVGKRGAAPPDCRVHHCARREGGCSQQWAVPKLGLEDGRKTGGQRAGAANSRLIHSSVRVGPAWQPRLQADERRVVQGPRVNTHRRQLGRRRQAGSWGCGCRWFPQSRRCLRWPLQSRQCLQ